MTLLSVGVNLHIHKIGEPATAVKHEQRQNKLHVISCYVPSIWQEEAKFLS